jgi:hypothetical protein
MFLGARRSARSVATCGAIPSTAWRSGISTASSMAEPPGRPTPEMVIMYPASRAAVSMP